MAVSERVKKSTIWVIVLGYAAAATVLLGRTTESFEDIRTFSNDEASICEQAHSLISARSLIPYDPTQPEGGPKGCSSYPYGQVYNVAIAVPLIFLQAITPIFESTVIKWAIIVLIVSGIATLLLTYRIGSRLYGRTYGLLAALLLLGTSEFVRWSHEIHPDLAQLALLTAGFYLAVCLYEHGAVPGRRWLLDLGLASFCAGAAMATKFNGVLLLPVIALAYNAPFLSGAKRFAWRDALKHNVGAGTACIAVFAAAWILFSPCFVFHPSLFLEPILRAATITSTELARPEGITRRLTDFLHSNHTIAAYVVGWAGYVIILGSMLVGFWNLLRHPGVELKRPRILADVFVLTVLFYSLGLGQGLYGGVLLNGYGRYVLPAVPIAYVAGMRIVHALAGRWQAHRWVLIVLAAFILLGQSGLIRTAVQQYQEFYLAKETGSYRVRDWVLEHIPRGSRIYADRYILIPREGYEVIQPFLIGQVALIKTSDYIITKTLAYDVFTDPDRWQRYSDAQESMAARRLHEILEFGRPRGIRKVAELSAGGTLGRRDAAIIYQNVNASQ